jgi:hypothetical protein
MPIFSLPHFGEIDLSNLEEYYDVDIEYNDRQLSIDLNFDGKSIDMEKMIIVKNFIERIAEWDKKNEKRIEDDYNNNDDGTVKFYVGFVMELNEEEPFGVIDLNNAAVTPQKQIIEHLHLVRVGLYPEQEEAFAIFDYTIGRDLIDHLVVIFADINGEMDYMTMES